MLLSGGRVAAIKEPTEGYEELEAIPHAFAVEFTDGDGPWCLFADSSEDKVRLGPLLDELHVLTMRQDVLVSLLTQAAGL